VELGKQVSQRSLSDPARALMGLTVGILSPMHINLIAALEFGFYSHSGRGSTFRGGK